MTPISAPKGRIGERIAFRLRQHLGPVRCALERAILAARFRAARVGVAPGAPECCIVFDIRRKGVGLFAELNWVLYCIAYAQSLGCHPVVRLGSGTYSGSNDPDWLGQYFDVGWRAVPASVRRRFSVTIRDLERQLPGFYRQVGDLSLWHAHDLTTRFLQPTDRIRQRVERYSREELGNNFIGIHWRGTDKESEAPPVSVESVVATAATVIASLSPRPSYFYLATDEQGLATSLGERFRRDFPTTPLKYLESSVRSTDGQPVHRDSRLGPAERYRMGEEAVTDCLLLARSRALVRTSSFLSGWSSVFNPVIPVYMLNAPYSRTHWFPDKETVLISQYYARSLAGEGPPRCQQWSPHRWPDLAAESPLPDDRPSTNGTPRNQAEG